MDNTCLTEFEGIAWFECNNYNENMENRMKNYNCLFCLLLCIVINLSFANLEDNVHPSFKGNIRAFTDNGMITSFAEEGDTLWAGFSGELRVYDLNRNKLLKRYKFGGHTFLGHVYEIKVLAGKIWVGTSVGLFSLNKQDAKWEVFLCVKELPPGELKVMDADPDGKGLWLGVSKSIYLGESSEIRFGYFDIENKIFKSIKIESDFIEILVATHKDVYFLTSYYGSDATRLIRFDRKRLSDGLRKGIRNEEEMNEGKEEKVLIKDVTKKIIKLSQIK